VLSSAMIASFGLLRAHRGGDANMRSAWICTRNDVLGNLAVLLAALGVFGTGTGWPDVIVAMIMAGLALQGAAVVLNRSRGELRSGHPIFQPSDLPGTRRGPGIIRRTKRGRLPLGNTFPATGQDPGAF
jgi:Co/Zn/Cd efflux system component